MRHGFVRAGEIAVLGATAPSPAWETVRPVTFGSDSDEQSGRIDCGRAGARRNWRDCVVSLRTAVQRAGRDGDAGRRRKRRKLGSAAWRERVWKYGEIRGVAL